MVSMQRPIRSPWIIAILLLASSSYAAPSRDAFSISWNLDEGSLGSWKKNEQGEIVLELAPGGESPWYYFQLDGVRNQTLTFVLEHAPAAWFGEITLPYVSYDQQEWETLKNRSIQPAPEDPASVRYRFTHTFGENRAWLAYAPPYPNSRLDAFLGAIGPHPHVHIEPVCETAEKRLPVACATLTDPEANESGKMQVYLMAREEAQESAGSWVCEGVMRFLLSDNPEAAAMKRRAVFHFIPILDRDGVTTGATRHVLPSGSEAHWSDTWMEHDYSFYEQRMIKQHLEQLREAGKVLSLLVRFRASPWAPDQLQREQAGKERYAAQDQLFQDLLGKKYLPWMDNLDRTLPATSLSRFAWERFPDAMTGCLQSGLVYAKRFGTAYLLMKTQADLELEGELLARAMGEFMGVPASDPPPFLHAAELYQLSGRGKETFHARCIYRDLLDRPPKEVRVVVNDQEIDLHPENPANKNFAQGVLFTGFITVSEPINRHYFTASNGSKRIRLPREGARPGPFTLPDLHAQREP